MDENAHYMVAIAEAGSISEAARRMHVSQPALSQRLKQLETRFGVELFDRQTSPLVPTYAGQVYLEWARRSIDEEACVDRELAAIANKTRRRLQIGTSLPRGNSILPEVVDRFYREVDGCSVFIHEAAMPQNYEHLFESGVIDCVMLVPTRPEPPAIVGEIVASERILLVAPAGMDLHAETVEGPGPYRVIKPEAVAGVPFVMPPSTLKLNRVIRTMMDTAGVRLNVAVHSCGNEMTIAMVRQGLGVTVLPNSFILAYLREGFDLYEMEGVSYSSSLYYSRRAGTVASMDEQIFVRLLKEWVAEHSEFSPSLQLPGQRPDLD